MGEPSRTLRYVGLPSFPEARQMGQEAWQRSQSGMPAFSTETVYEDPEWPGALGKIARVASIPQQVLFGAGYGAIEPDESILGGIWKGLRGKRIVRFRYFLDRLEDELDVEIPNSVAIGFGWAGDIFLDPIWMLKGPAALTKAGRATKRIQSARAMQKAGIKGIDWGTPALARDVAQFGKGAALGGTLAEQAVKGERALMTVGLPWTGGAPIFPRAFSAKVFQHGSAFAKKALRTRGMEATLRAFGVTPNPEFNKWMRQENYRRLFLQREAQETTLELGEIAGKGAMKSDDFRFISRVLETPIDKRIALEAEVLQRSLPVQEFIAKASPIFDEWYKAQVKSGVPIKYLAETLEDQAKVLRKRIRKTPRGHSYGTLWEDLKVIEEAIERKVQYLPHIDAPLNKALRRAGMSAGELEGLGGGGFGRGMLKVKYGDMLQRKIEGDIATINKGMLKMARDEFPDVVKKLERRTFWERALRKEADPARLEYFATNPVAITGQYGAAAARARAVAEFFEGAVKGAKEGSIDWLMPVAEVGDQLKKGSWLRVAAPELEGFAMPRALARMVDQHVKALTNEPFVRGITKIYDDLLSYTRGIALVAPSYHVRNVLGGNLMHGAVHGGTTNPVRYLRDGWQMSLHWAGEMWQKPGVRGFRWLRNYADDNIAMNLNKVVVQGKTGKFTLRQLYDLAKEHGVPGEGFMARMIDRGAAKAPIIRQNRELGMLLENVSRFGHFVDRVLKGDAPYDAARSVAKYFFNYAELGQLEKQVGRRLIFFYAWPRNNLILHARRFFEYPAVDAKVAQMINRAQQSPLAAPRDLVPRWVREQIGIPVRKNPDGTHNYWMLANWIPEAEIYKIAETFKEEGMEGFRKIFGTYAAPPIRWGIEKLTNSQLYFDRKIEEFPGDSINFLGVPMRKHLAYWVSQLRFLSEIDRINPFNIFGDKRYGKTEIQGALTKAGVALVGRMYAVAPEKEAQRQQWEKQNKERELKRAVRAAARAGDTKMYDKYLKMLDRFYRDEYFF